MTLTYLTGDATQPVKTPALIMHVCNDIGKWGRGFVLAISRRWPHVEQAYRDARRYKLGTVQFVRAAPDIQVVNMIAQHGIYSENGVPPIRYDALAECLREVGGWLPPSFHIHAPRLGAGLAGGSWSVIEPLIEFYLKDREVYIYDLPSEKT